MNQFSKLIAVAVSVFVTASADAVTYTASENSKASFNAVGRPSLLKIKGEGAKVVGSIDIEANSVGGTFEVLLDQFDTGIDLRNRHMKEKYLETTKFPKAILKIESVELPAGFQPGSTVEAAKFKGLLTVKNVSHPIVGTVSISQSTLTTKANFEFSLNNYPVGVPSYLGVTVADNVQVEVNIPGFTKR